MDTIVVRVVASLHSTAVASLLDRFGQRLIELPVTGSPEARELTIALGSFVGDDAAQRSARSAAEAQDEDVAFRVAR